MHGLKIYLAGDMHSGWQDEFARIARPPHEIIDPRKHGLTTPANYTRWDLQGVARCDILVAYMHPGNPSGYGMSLEIGYALGLGKRVIFIDGIGLDWRSKYFDMVRETSIVVPTIHEAAAVISH